MFAKRTTEIIPEEATSIWACSNENCSGWMRDNFSFKNVPTCPVCKSEMVLGEKMLPFLHNNNKKDAL
jgi:hypothetical protein